MCPRTTITAIDALIVGVETQQRYLAKKKTWTRKIILLTDGESPIQIEDWKLTTKKMNDHDISLLIMYVNSDIANMSLAYASFIAG